MFKVFSWPDSFTQKSTAMKNNKSKKLSKRIDTICDFSSIYPKPYVSDTTQTGGTDTTNTTLTIITTAHAANKPAD